MQQIKDDICAMAHKMGIEYLPNKIEVNRRKTVATHTVIHTIEGVLEEKVANAAELLQDMSATAGGSVSYIGVVTRKGLLNTNLYTFNKYLAKFPEIHRQSRAAH